MIKFFFYKFILTWTFIEILAILNGVPVTWETLPKYKYVAHIGNVYNNATCSGVIVDNNKIVTAAHCLNCLDAEDVVVKVSCTNASVDGVTVKAIYLKEHNDFGKPTFGNNDIAVLILAEPLIFNERVGSVKVATSADEYMYSNTLTSVTITGYGMSERNFNPGDLNTIQLPLVDWQLCQEIFNQSYPETLTTNMTCYGNVDDRSTTQGDSGGPVVFPGPEETLIGIVSWGKHSGFGACPQVAVKVNTFSGFINNLSINTHKVHKNRGNKIKCT